MCMDSFNSFYKTGLRFSCTKCSRCCRGTPGVVFLTENDLSRLCGWAQLSREQFVQLYCHWIENEQGEEILSLRELQNYDCIFWKAGIGCEAYEARPVQCRTYPFWSQLLKDRAAWEHEKYRCPGLDSGAFHAESEIEAVRNCHEEQKREFIKRPKFRKSMQGSVD